MITKTNTYKIKHKPDANMFVRDYDNLILRKSKQIMNTNSELTKC
jgi:hypothetical protein